MSRTVTIVGAGSIGVGFAVHFASAGFTVRVWDAMPDAYPRARAEIESKFSLLQEEDLLNEPIATVMQRIGFFEILLDALKGADLVQECAPEKVAIKREIFQQVGAYSRPDAVLASSSSAIVSSDFATATPARDRVIIAHPGNPPYLIPIIEIVPSSYTSEETVSRAMDIYRESGLKPVRINKEIEGFVFNRLQGAVLREAYCLVRDGVISVDDLDEVMRSGPGRRWAFIGPFETSDLNTRGGIASHAEKMGPSYERMGAERGQSDPWTPDLVSKVESERRALLPLDQWSERVAWRDRQLMALKKLFP